MAAIIAGRCVWHSGSPLFVRPHVQPVSQTKRDAWLWFDRRMRHQFEPVSLRQHDQNDASLQRREVGADALMRSRAEWQVRVRGPSGGLRRGEALGIERARIGPERLVTMQDEWTDHDRRAAGDVIAADDVACNRAALEDPDRGIQPQRLVEDHAGVLEMRNIFERGLTPVTDDGRHFGSEAPLDLRMGRQQKQRPGQRASRGFVARQQQGEGLIAELRARHPPRAPVVDGAKQVFEQVGMVFVTFAPLLDDAIDHTIDRESRLVEPAVARGRNPQREVDQPFQAVRM